MKLQNSIKRAIDYFNPLSGSRRRLPMLNRRVLTSAVVALATTITTQSFAQDRGTDAPPAAGAKAGATQGTFTTSDAIPWKPVDSNHPGLQMFAVWGNPNEGASEILQKFPAGMDRSEEHTSELQSPDHLVCRLLLEKKKIKTHKTHQSCSVSTPYTSLST